MIEFRWNEWNLDHATKHGVSPYESEMVVRDAQRPYPKRVEKEKWMVHGRGIGGRYVQVFYLVDDDGTLYIIHARLLSGIEKQRYRKRNR
jgi:uncharacterized DUF497 family protein